jgi:hypothetical protein
MSLYDEIMALDQTEDRHCSDYGRGFMDAIEAAAELAKKYDEERQELIDALLYLSKEDIGLKIKIYWKD